MKSIGQHSVSRNAAALGVMQIANYAVPLLLLPFLTRQLGMEAFGMVAITLAAIQLAFVLTDYGFSLSATYSISTNRENTDFVNQKISAIFGAKALLVSLLAAGLIIASQTVPSLQAYSTYIIAAFIAICAQAFQPIWLFQGIERMKNITLYTVLTKVLYAILVLQLISTPEDAVIVIFCWSAAQVIGLAASLYFMYSAGYRVSWPSLKTVRHEFVDGAQFFWSRLAVAVYTSASTLVVGSQSATQAAQFAACEQIYKAGQNVTSPINNAMFPYMTKHKDWKVFYKLLLITSITISTGCLILAYCAKPFLTLLFGSEYGNATSVLLVFLCTTIINYFCVTFGYSAFAALGRVDIANTTVIAGAIIHTFALYIVYLNLEISALTIAACILFTEFCVMISRITAFYIIKKRQNDEADQKPK